MTDRTIKDRLVYVVDFHPLHEADRDRTIDKMAQSLKELREDGIQIGRVSLHIRDSAEIVLEAAGTYDF